MSLVPSSSASSTSTRRSSHWAISRVRSSRFTHGGLARGSWNTALVTHIGKGMRATLSVKRCSSDDPVHFNSVGGLYRRIKERAANRVRALYPSSKTGFRTSASCSRSGKSRRRVNAFLGAGQRWRRAHQVRRPHQGAASQPQGMGCAAGAKRLRRHDRRADARALVVLRRDPGRHGRADPREDAEDRGGNCARPHRGLPLAPPRLCARAFCFSTPGRSTSTPGSPSLAALAL